MVILKSGPRRGEPGADKIVWEHGRRNFALRAEGLQAIVCPVNDGSESPGNVFRGEVREKPPGAMNEPAPKLFIFDMGGVVSRNTNVFIPVAGHLGLAPESLRELTRDALARLIIGKISAREFWEIFSQRSGLEVGEDLLARFFQPSQDPEVVALVEALRGRGRVVVGTNTIESHYRIHWRQGDYEPFDAVYASHRMGLAKPDPAFYNYILRQEGFAAREAVFTDDLPQNVQAAAALGIQALQFNGAAELKKQIEQLPG